MLLSGSGWVTPGVSTEVPGRHSRLRRGFIGRRALRVFGMLGFLNRCVYGKSGLVGKDVFVQEWGSVYEAREVGVPELHGQSGRWDRY